jgi:tRNA 2-selenouridine synthase
MPQKFATLHDLLTHGFDTVIDVRSPSEFAIDHMPGAINLPALSDAQRQEVGTIYKQISPFDARKLGASLVARNVADHVAGPLAQHGGGWRPLVYCWRGGQRSGSFNLILQQIGWRSNTIEGGYTAWRHAVKSTLYDEPIPHDIVLLDGNTGTAKTAILARLADRGVQVIDLEGLAGHRGSLLGETAKGQPHQKAFETALATALDACDPNRPVVVEAESNKIGRINLPPSLWSRMIDAPRIMMDAPVAARATFLVFAYADIIADPARLTERLKPLRYIRGHAMVEGWLKLLRDRDHHGLATTLITDHYDAAYAKSRAIHTADVIGDVQVATLDDAGQDDATRQIIDILSVR